MTRTLIATLLAVAIAPSAARADDTFEVKAAGAQRITKIEDLVWALTATCDAGDDTQQRQCRHVRDTRAAELAGATLIVDAEPEAFTAGPWNPQAKSVPLGLSGCIRCAGLDVDGKVWFIASSSTQPRFEGGKLKAASLHDNARPFPDEASAKAFLKNVAKAKIQLIVKIPAKPQWKEANHFGLALDVLGYRVFTPCDGGIVCASPHSGPADVDRGSCGGVTSGTVPDDAKLETLTPALITQAMKPVVDAAHACFEKFGRAGKAKLKITIGGDGKVLNADQTGDFPNTPTGVCIDEAMETVTFPKSKKPKTTISYPIVLQ